MSQRDNIIRRLRRALILVKIRIWDKTFKFKFCKENSVGIKKWKGNTPGDAIKCSVNACRSSADEKIRSIGGKHPPKPSNKSIQQPPLPPRNSNSLPLQYHNVIGTTKVQNDNTIEDTEMTDRRTQKNINNRQTDPRPTEVTRRSRSAGPSGKIKMRNSLDEKKLLAAQEKKNKSSRYYQRKQELKNGTRYSLYNEPVSDEGGFPDYSSSASDSDGHYHRKWVKNPLNTRKVRKSDKTMTSGKHDNGVYSINENEYNRMENQNLKNVSRSSQVSTHDYQDRNVKNKFHKLEERRNQRIDYTVTSDEELNSPEIGISKLRQRALQGSKFSNKLPDTLEEWNIVPNSPQVSSQVEIKRTIIEKDAQIENGSSSSEQITLRQIGPGRPSYDGPKPSNNTVKVDDCQQNEINKRQRNLPQGSYRKIPKQESDFLHIHNNNISHRDTSVGNSFYRMKELPSGGYVKYNINSQSGPRERERDTIMQFNEGESNKTHSSKQLIETADKPRKSYSDDDCLDDLIESNIQYLESEFESGRLKKINDSMPARFPNEHHYRDQFENQRRSRSLESEKKPSQSDSFQSEVRLRLQIPSMSQNNRQQSRIEKYNRSELNQPNHTNKSSMLKSQPTPQSNTFDTYNRSLFQNTVPKLERKFQSATASPYLQRRVTELADMEDMSKSENRLNSIGTGFSYQRPSNFIHPYLKEYCTTTQTTTFRNRGDNVVSKESVTKSVSVPAMESGMFSDVDYDIEVAERIKKWEKFMKKPQAGEDEKATLSTIEESASSSNWNLEPEIPVAIPQTLAVSSTSVTVTKSKPHPFDPVTNQSSTETTKSYFEPKVKSVETNTHRIFRVVQDPRCCQVLTSSTENKLNWVQSPLITEQKRHNEKDNSQNGCVEESVLMPNVISKQGWPPQSSAFPVKAELKMARLSRFEDEINELQDIKIDSVKDLRKKFDSDASGNESTDFTDTPATPVRMTPLRQRRQIHVPPPMPESNTKYMKIHEKHVKPPQIRQQVLERKQGKSVIDKCSSRSPDADVWSPNMKSEQGLVSIERVKARTLQTIPFSEDPIWKQIEEMTNINDIFVNDNNELETPLSKPLQESVVLKRNSYIEFNPPTSILTSESRVTDNSKSQNVTKIPNARPFITPVIKPLKLSVATKSSVDALDEVLEDIRSTLQRKPLSPSAHRKRSENADSTSVLSPTVSSTGEIFFPTKSCGKETRSAPFHSALSYTNPQTYIQQDYETSNSSIQQPAFPPQNQYDQPVFADPDYNKFPYIVNGNYQLDPYLLKEKLLGTGLADTCSESEDVFKRVPPVPPERKHSVETQVLRSMEELKNLAEEVEVRLHQIKKKILNSSEEKLDYVVSSLRKFEPDISIKSAPSVSENQDEQSKRKEKMEEALTELNRIYKYLDIDGGKSKGPAIGRSQSFTKDTSRPIFKRTLSDSNYSVNVYRDECVDEVEKETQREFEDINKSFQTLLAEVSSEPLQTTDSKQSECGGTADHSAEINAALESFLDEFHSSNRGKEDALDPLELKRRFENKENAPAIPNRCREIQKSEVFTACSGPFSVLVGINGNPQKPRPKPKPRNKATNMSQSNEDNLKSSTNNETAEASKHVEISSAYIQVSPSLSVESESKDISECEESKSKHVPRRFRSSKNFNHRKSMPAEMIQKSVETQTTDTNWLTSVKNMREIYINNSREDSISSESSVDNRGPKRRRQIAKGIAMMLDIFSSSEDERGQKKLSHSHSAPDLRDLFESENSKRRLSNKTYTPRFVKHRQEARSRKRSSEFHSKDKTSDEKTDEFSLTSTTSDDGCGSKPPLHPGAVKQRPYSPDKNENRKFSIKETNDQPMRAYASDTELKPSVMTRHCDTSINREEVHQERPRSFHELLATFESDPLRLIKLQCSLRKCVSVDSFGEKTIITKTFSSEPDLSKTHMPLTGTKLHLEVSFRP